MNTTNQDQHTASKQGAPILNSSNFAQTVETSKIPVLVDFYADWCGPCQMAAPIIDKLAGQYAGKLQITKLNVDESRDIAVKYGVMSIPTVLIFKEGKVVDQQVGFPGEEGYVAMLDKALTS